MKSIYGQTVPLKKALKHVECWNFTGRETFNIPAGALVQIDNVYDTTRTTVAVMNQKGECCGINCSGNRIGYRFIVDNVQLAKATGLDIPKTTRDLVGEMMAFENGEMDEDQARSLLTALKQDGTLGKLQGSYGRAAKALGVI